QTREEEVGSIGERAPARRGRAADSFSARGGSQIGRAADQPAIANIHFISVPKWFDAPKN
ncbi:MAG: hypothetical protein ABIG45_01950, partial [Bacillota bacterium]